MSQVRVLSRPLRITEVFETPSESLGAGNAKTPLGTEDVVVVMHEGCGLHGASEDAFAEQLRADGVLPTWRLGAFADVEATLRDSLSRLRSSAELPHRDHVRGFVFNPEDGTLREVA